MKNFIIFASIIILTSCNAVKMQVSEYHPAAKKLNLSSLPRLNIGDFTSTQDDAGHIGCRVGHIAITAGDHITFRDYFKSAFIKELSLDGKYSPTAKTTIRGIIENIEVNSIDGYLQFDILLTSNNGRSLPVSHTSEFDSAFNGVTGCNAARKHFMPAVQELIGIALTNSEFINLIK